MTTGNRPLLTICLLFIIVLSIGYFFTWSAYSTYERTKRDLAGLTSDLDSLKEKQTLIKQLEAAQPTLGQQAAKARALVPVEEERQIFVSQIDRLAQASQVQLVTFSFTPSAVKKKKTTEDDDSTDRSVADKTVSNVSKSTIANPLTFRATIVGPYAAVLDFLRQLEGNERATVLNTVDLTSAPDNTNTTLTFEAAIYTKPAPKIAPDMSFKGDDWDYLTELYPNQVLPVGGRADPFAPYVAPTEPVTIVSPTS